MATVVAVKLPNGLVINHRGRRIELNGTNFDADPLIALPNGSSHDVEGKRAGGFGLTELKDPADEEAFKDWAKAVTFDQDGKTKLREPFLPIENGSILVFDNMSAATKEAKGMSSAITSGFEGVDPNDKAFKAAGLAPDDEGTNKRK